jgi:Leucine-rich repeat (LRR) protein
VTSAPLAGLKDLLLLDLRRNHIADIAPLGKLTNWRDLYLDQNQISDLTPLMAVTQNDAKLGKYLASERSH